ncbi:hypothetical protein BJ508DRAFT_336912 [Ascobolus immersus RN42]|uniref:Uncharacterized protein n=1 Tax=Ascobolus immersus RN42 TaxID=1160509 RepID=A0A3N4HB42_ASCIM|nr:hypothetical protein BJ508DRAFT_336912 [Ascobolus immersus RN42]
MANSSKPSHKSKAKLGRAATPTLGTQNVMEKTQHRRAQTSTASDTVASPPTTHPPTARPTTGVPISQSKRQAPTANLETDGQQGEKQEEMHTIEIGEGDNIEVPRWLVDFMLEAKNSTEWKGRCRIFVCYLFLITRHLPKESHRDIINAIMPATLNDDDDEFNDSLAYLSRQIKTGFDYLRKMFSLHLKRWYKSKAAVWWRDLKAQEVAADRFAEDGEDFPFPQTIRDLFSWNGKSGFEFGHYHMVHFWRRFLQYMDIETDANGDIGWIRDDAEHKYFWYENLRSVVLRVILTVIQTQGPDPLDSDDLENLGTLKLAFRSETFRIPLGTSWPAIGAKWKNSAAPLFNDSSRYPTVSHDLKLHYDIHFYSDDVAPGNPSAFADATGAGIGDLLDPANPRRIMDTDGLADFDFDEETDDMVTSWYDAATDSLDIDKSIQQVDPDSSEKEVGDFVEQVHLGWQVSKKRLDSANVIPEYKRILLPLSPDTPFDHLSSSMKFAGQRWTCGDIEVKVALTEAHLDQYYSAIEEQVSFLQDRKDSLLIRFKTVEAKKRKIQQILELRANLENILDDDEAAVARAESDVETSRKKHRIRPAEADRIHHSVSSLRRRREVTGAGFSYSKQALKSSVLHLGLPNEHGFVDLDQDRQQQDSGNGTASNQFSLSTPTRHTFTSHSFIPQTSRSPHASDAGAGLFSSLQLPSPSSSGPPGSRFPTHDIRLATPRPGQRRIVNPIGTTMSPEMKGVEFTDRTVDATNLPLTPTFRGAFTSSTADTLAGPDQHSGPPQMDQEQLGHTTPSKMRSDNVHQTEDES